MCNTSPDHGEAKKPSLAENTEEEINGTDTPRKPNMNSGLLESQLYELQDKLAEFEKRAELERLERERLEYRMIHEMPPLIAPIFDGDDVAEALHRHRTRYFIGNSDGVPPGPPGTYITRAIDSFERELKRLHREKDKIQDLWEDRHRLRSMEDAWTTEREELLKKQTELRRLVGKMPGPLDALNSVSGATAPEKLNLDLEEQPPAHGNAQLNPVDWTNFRLSPTVLRETFVIDVLTGEPAIRFEHPRNNIYSRSRRGFRRPISIPDEKPKLRKSAIPKQSSIPGQAPLPERIRINSKYILKILETIDDQAFSGDGPVVMVRPYKALGYYDELIRQKFAELERKFPPQTSDPERLSVGEIDSSNEEGHAAEPDQDERETQDNAVSEDDGHDESTSSLTAYQHLKCLIQFMDGDIRKKLAYLDSDACQTVFFSDIWYLFKPGDEVIEQSRRQAYRIVSVISSRHRVFPPWRISWDKEADRAEEETPVILNCVYIDYDGKHIGPMTRKVRIARFDGEKAVTSLEVFPLRYAEEKKGDATPQKPTFRERLITRGKMFLDMTSFKHMHYSGLTLNTREEVDSHVVVDFEEAFSAKHDLEWRPDLNNLITPEDEDDANREACDADCCKDDNVHDDSYAEKKRNQEYMGLLVPEDRQREPSPAIYPRLLQDIKNQENALAEEDLVVMSYRVFGFILRTRKWAQLDLNHLGPPETSTGDGTSSKNDLQEGGSASEVVVDGDTDKGKTPKGTGVKEGLEISSKPKEAPRTSFERLVLPPGHKDMVVSLVAQHFRDKESKETHQVDIVRGKGKGLIILLHGAPGVGKTTTAEGVAEMFKKPLYQITCGDLGTKAREVEEALEMHFALANRWGCVLLLDEADVFLAARSKEDFIRNGLVSVFLRVLEYYAGILFLTTNRVGDFDEAFASRIHISLYYPQLDLASTKAIFKLNLDLINERFMSKNREIEIKEDEILKFAQEYFEAHGAEKWNGRQIRNACQTALALAEFRAQGDDYKQVEHVDAVVELKVEDLKTVSKAYLQFMQYLNEVRGNDVDRWAKALKIRAREMDVLLSQSGYEGKGKGRKGGDGGESRLKTVPAASTHPWGTQVGMPSAGQSASLPPQSQPQAASQAPSAAPTGPISAPQYVPPFNTAPPGYYGGLHYGQPQGFAAPPFMPAGTAQAPVAEPQPGPPPQSVQSQQNMGGWTPEAVAAWYRQQTAQQQVPPQGPQPGQPPPFNMPNSTGNPSG
ncbi:hypothetical protein DL767_004641 [Monosporascus sp. MG133]|nr:hypothetical protein DL767_004641 [Monosporascus sp. MG133]